MHRFHLKVGYLLRKEITEVYVMNAIRAFAISMVAIFIPIYLLGKGFLFLDVCLYLLGHSIIGIFACYFALVVCSKYGAKHSIYMSIPITLLYFFALYNLGFLLDSFNKYIVLLLLVLLHSVFGALYYMGFHIEFAKFSEEGSSAKQFGMVNIFATIFGAIGPLIGSLIVSYFNGSFSILFLFVMFLMLLCVVPLLFSGEIHEKFDFNLKDLKRFKFTKRSVPFIAEGVHDFSSRMFWPLILFFYAISLAKIGGLYAISNGIIVIFTIFIGKIVTKENKHKILRLGTIFHSFSMVIRTFLTTISSIAIVQGFGGLSWTMINLPFASSWYNNSKKKGIGYYIFFREFFLHIGRGFIILVLMALLNFFTPLVSLIIGLLIGAGITLLMPLIVEE